MYGQNRIMPQNRSVRRATIKRRRKSADINLRIDRERKRHYRTAAVESGMSLSAWMLDACDEFLLRHLAANR